MERVNDYEYLGIIISETRHIGWDSFTKNHFHLCTKTRSSVYVIMFKLNKLGHLPFGIATHFFNTVVEPILTYGTEVLGVNKKGTEQIDKLCAWYFKSIQWPLLLTWFNFNPSMDK